MADSRGRHRLRPGAEHCRLGLPAGSGPAGSEITLRYGEMLTPDGAVDQSNINSLVYPEQGEVQLDRYILKGDGLELYEPRFSYHGFQYVEVTGAPGQLTLDDLLGCLVHTAFDRAGSFTCSSEVVNRLQACTEWSYVNNFVGYPTDCPQREKNGWTVTRTSRPRPACITSTLTPPIGNGWMI